MVPSEYVKFHGPLPVKAMLTEGKTEPTHPLPPPLTVAVGKGLTVTVATAVFGHPREVPVTVYVAVAAGDAVAVAIPVDVAPADHVYVVPPLAVKLAVCPEQMVGEFTIITGKGFTVIVT